MDNEQKIMFSVSQEELFVILTYLQASALMGLDGSLLNELSDEQTRLVLGVAERALIAREFLVNNEENQFELAPAILSVVGGCAKPDKSMIINFSRPDRPTESMFFHKTLGILLGHTKPMTAIHQFFVVEEDDFVPVSVGQLLNLNGQTAPLKREEPFIVPQTLVTQARDKARDEGLQASQTVLAQNNSTEFAAAFAQSLTNSVANLTLVSINHQAEGEAQTDGFTFLQGENGFWLLQPRPDVSDDQDMVSITPLAAAAVETNVKTLNSMFVE